MTLQGDAPFLLDSGLMMAWKERSNLKPFEERPLWLSVQLEILDALLEAKQLKRANQMDKWSKLQTALERWLVNG